MAPRFNIAILGKTGVGKSSLINYLLGDYQCEARAGAPVTGKGLHPLDIELQGMPATLFDSWGLEASKATEWTELLSEELARRGARAEVKDWFHVILYCIQASGHRIEPIDTQIIKQFLASNYRLVVVLTKADAIDAENRAKLEAAIQAEVGQRVPVVAVCSDEKKLLGGRTTERFGRERLVEEIRQHLWDSILLRLPERCEELVLRRIEQWYAGWELVVRQETGLFNLKEIYTRVNKAAEVFEEQIRTGLFTNLVMEEIEKTFAIYLGGYRGIAGPQALTVPRSDFAWKSEFGTLGFRFNQYFIAYKAMSTWGISLIWQKESNVKQLMQFLGAFRQRLLSDVHENLPGMVASVLEQARRDSELTPA